MLKNRKVAIICQNCKNIANVLSRFSRMVPKVHQDVAKERESRENKSKVVWVNNLLGVKMKGSKKELHTQMYLINMQCHIKRSLFPSLKELLILQGRFLD